MWESEDGLQEWVPSFRDGSGDHTPTIRLKRLYPLSHPTFPDCEFMGLSW